MPKNPTKRPTAPKRNAKTRKPSSADSFQTPMPEAAQSQGSFETLKDNLKKIDKGNLFDALKRVKDMKPEEWRDPGAVRELTENIAQDIGIRVDPKRIDAFMNAFNDVAKNAGDKGPNVSVEDIAKKYAGDAVDDRTIKEIKKFVK